MAVTLKLLGHGVKIVRIVRNLLPVVLHLRLQNNLSRVLIKYVQSGIITVRI